MRRKDHLHNIPVLSTLCITLQKNMMISLQIETLIQRSQTISHLLQIHSFLLKSALNHHEYLLSKFILSSSSISLDFARSIFDNSPITPPLFSWNTMIKHYSKSSSPLQSVKLFCHLQRLSLQPDKYTYPFVIKACGRCLVIGVGGTLHSLILKTGFDSDRYVCNTLLSMYAACGTIGFARKVFDEMSERDVVSWSSMIAGYVHCKYPLNALKLFQEMKQVKVNPNSVTLVTVLSACTHLLNIQLGKSIHSHIVINEIAFDVSLGTALLEIYAKCGYIAEAFQIFKSMSEKNLQCWTIMISGLADNGRGEEAIAMFNKMEEIGLKPDSISFSAVLCACSHLGSVAEGQKYFDQMINMYNIQPTMEHYGCLVDMLGRSGMIEEAYKSIRSMPMVPNSVILRSFISACKHHDNTTFFDENVREQLLQMEPEVGANYVLSAGLSSLSGDWRDVDVLRNSMKGKGLKKNPGCSWLEVNSGSGQAMI